MRRLKFVYFVVRAEDLAKVKAHECAIVSGVDDLGEVCQIAVHLANGVLHESTLQWGPAPGYLAPHWPVIVRELNA